MKVNGYEFTIGNKNDIYSEICKKYFSKYKTCDNTFIFEDVFYNEPVNVSIKMVSPMRYLSDCAKLVGMDFNSFIRLKKDFTLKSTKEWCTKNKEIPIPYIDLIKCDQDGAHRALVALQVRLFKIPVLYITKINNSEANVNMADKQLRVKYNGKNYKVNANDSEPKDITELRNKTKAAYKKLKNTRKGTKAYKIAFEEWAKLQGELTHEMFSGNTVYTVDKDGKEYFKWIDGFDGGEESNIFNSMQQCKNDALKHIKNIRLTKRELEELKKKNENYVSFYTCDEDGDLLKELGGVEINEKTLGKIYDSSYVKNKDGNIDQKIIKKIIELGYKPANDIVGGEGVYVFKIGNGKDVNKVKEFLPSGSTVKVKGDELIVNIADNDSLKKFKVKVGDKNYKVIAKDSNEAAKKAFEAHQKLKANDANYNLKNLVSQLSKQFKIKFKPDEKMNAIYAPEAYGDNYLDEQIVKFLRSKGVKVEWNSVGDDGYYYIKDAKSMKDYYIPQQFINELKRYANKFGYDFQEVDDGYNVRIKLGKMAPKDAIEDLKECMANGDTDLTII